MDLKSIKMTHSDIWKKGKEVEKYVGALVREHVSAEEMKCGGDFLVGPGRHIVLEIKSAEVMNGSGAGRLHSKFGKFYVDASAHKLLSGAGYKNWYALALTYKSMVILLRFVPASKLEVSGTYASLSNLYSGFAAPLEQFIEKVKQDEDF